jgi:hypothetical protein
MLKAFFISFLIVTIIAFVILVFLMGKFVVEHGLSGTDYEEETKVIQNAIDNGDFLACFMDDWASAMKIITIIDIVLAVLVLL